MRSCPDSPTGPFSRSPISHRLHGSPDTLPTTYKTTHRASSTVCFAIRIRLSSKALLLQFAPELGGVMASLFPALLQILSMLSDHRWAARVLALWEPIGVPFAGQDLSCELSRFWRHLGEFVRSPLDSVPVAVPASAVVHIAFQKAAWRRRAAEQRGQSAPQASSPLNALLLSAGGGRAQGS